MTPAMNAYTGYMAMLALFALWAFLEKTETGRKIGQWFDKQFN